MILRMNKLRNQKGFYEFSSTSFIVVEAKEISYHIIRQMRETGAIMAVVCRHAMPDPSAEDIVGVITKDQVADSVADTVMGFNDA